MPVNQRLLKAATAAVAAVLATVGLALTAPAHGASTEPGSEPYRPYLHYTPQKNWMNDPNGLVFYKGVYHLFYQYNPYGTTWGNMSWGHATSPDLVHWTEQPLALPQDADADIFSGSIVVDHANTSGFGTSDNPPLVAMYTSAYNTGKQAQSLAYSTDEGQTWTKYAGNPVIDRNSTNFRDPHVFWYDGGSPSRSYWVVVTVEANDHQVHLYKSADLKSWTHLSVFGPANAVGGQWECPDLFPMAVDGDPNNVKWVLVVNINPGAVAGGSGGQYFVGTFDGTTFTSESSSDFNSLPAGTTFADFDSGSYAGWRTNNQPAISANGPFGDRPATGTLAGQLPVTGFAGSGLVNGFEGGDAPTGSLDSPDFTVDKDHINFLVGGGNHPWQDGTSMTGSDPTGAVTQDFERTGWDDWTATGGLVGSSPATGALGGQQVVTSYRGRRLLNTFLDGDGTTGTLTSPQFTIDSAAIDFLIGGGNHPWGQANPTAFNLVVDGQVVRTATGRDSENTVWQGWDVSDLRGRQATLQVVDANSGGWGHLLLDQVTFSDSVTTTYNDFEGPGWGPGWTATGAFVDAGPAAGTLGGQGAVTGFEGGRLVNTFTAGDAPTGTITSPAFTVSSDAINLLVGGGNHPWGAANPTSVNLVVDGNVVRTATGHDSEALDWVSWDVGQFRGKQASIQIVDQNSGGWGHLNVDSITFAGNAALPRSTATAVNLVVDDKVVRTATGNNSEQLDWKSWNVSDLVGQRAHISIVDGNSGTGEGAWGHILADQFMFSDAAALPRLQNYGWLDWGRDFYAGVTYDNAPDNKRIMIAWMNNWDYANQIPTGQWRSAMALPRELSLRTIDGRPQVVQKVVDQVDGLERAASYTSGPTDIDPGVTMLPSRASGSVLKIDAVLSPGTASKFGLIVRQSANGSQQTPVLYDVADGRLSVDRTRSGNVSFSASFPSTESAPVKLENGKLHLELYVDRASVEVFAQDGVRAITDQIFPDDTSTAISLVSQGGTAHLESLSVTPLNRAMFANTQAITFDPLADKTYGDPDFAVAATASSGLPVTFTATGTCTVTDADVHLTGAGTCTVTASQDGDDTYNSAPSVARSFTVAKRAQTITFDPLGAKTYGDPDFTVAAHASSGLPVAMSVTGVCSLAGTTVHLTGAGTCTITASQDGDDTSSAAPTATQTISVAKARLTVTASDGAMTYGGTPPTISPTYSGFVGLDGPGSVSVPPLCSANATSSTPAGTYAGRSSCAGAAATNYALSYVNGKVTVAKATLTVRANDAGRVWGVTNPPLVASYSGFVNGENESVLTGQPSLTTTATTTSHPGSYPITPAQGTLVSANYAFTFSGGTLTVTRAPVTVAVSNVSRKAALTSGKITFAAKVAHASTGSAVPGVSVTFGAWTLLGYTPACSAVTSLVGVATCSVPVWNPLLLTVGTTITATAATTADTLSGSGTAAVVK